LRSSKKIVELDLILDLFGLSKPRVGHIWQTKIGSKLKKLERGCAKHALRLNNLLRVRETLADNIAGS
jgi:hypothetical protein